MADFLAPRLLASVGVALCAACGVTVDDDDDDPTCNSSDTDIYAVAEAWIREPTDAVAEIRWEPTAERCESNLIEQLDVSQGSSIYVSGFAPSTLNCVAADPDPRCVSTEWLRRLGPDYKELWKVSFNPRVRRLYGLAPTSGGGVILAGADTKNDPDTPWIARYNPEGVPVRQRRFSDAGQLQAVAVGPEGELVAVGDTLHEGAERLWVIKLDPAGDLLWDAHIGPPYQDTGTAVAIDPQGRIWVTALIGSRYTSPGRGSDPQRQYRTSGEGSLVALLDPDGTEVWVDESLLSDSDSEGEAGAMAIALFPNGDALVGGRLGESGTAASLTRYDPSGAKLWRTTFGDGELASLVMSGAGDSYAVSGPTLFHHNGDGELIEATDEHWASTDELDVGQSSAMAVKADGTLLLSGFFRTGWVRVYN